MYIFAGIIAATSAWVTKWLSLRLFSPLAVIYILPLQEEIYKTYMALFFNTSIVLTHGVFGFLEGIKYIMAWRNIGFSYGINVFLGNLLFGYMAAEFYKLYHQVIIAIFGAYIFHIIWNIFITKITIHE